MSFIEKLLEDGGDFAATRSRDSVSFSPAGGRDSDLASFQGLVHRLREREGVGFRIFREHTSSDHAEDLVDLVMVTLEGGDGGHG